MNSFNFPLAAGAHSGKRNAILSFRGVIMVALYAKVSFDEFYKKVIIKIKMREYR